MRDAITGIVSRFCVPVCRLYPQDEQRTARFGIYRQTADISVSLSRREMGTYGAGLS